MSTEKILLFIPGYNCEKQIIRVLAQLNKEVRKYITEVIMVNNRSTDNTETAVEEFISTDNTLPITLLRNDENYGLGGSHKVAFQYAQDNGFDYVIVLHGDDQGSIKDILPLLESGEYKNYDCCLGARFMKGSSLPGYSAFRTFGNRVYNLLFSIVCGRMIYDLGSGLNMYNVSMLKSKYYIKYPDNLTFNYCMVMALQYYKQSALFFPISWREDDQVSNVKLFSQAKRVLGMLGNYAIGHKKFMKKELRENSQNQYTAKQIFSNARQNNEP
ncbi:MAG: glycosyltransferase family 2 protein [Oscillospiraceae bacterium]